MKKVNEVKEIKLGRPVNPNSVRQIRLAELEAKRSNGELKRGRPVDTTSARQFRLQIQAINKQLGMRNIKLWLNRKNKKKKTNKKVKIISPIKDCDLLINQGQMMV